MAIDEKSAGAIVVAGVHFVFMVGAEVIILPGASALAAPAGCIGKEEIFGRLRQKSRLQYFSKLALGKFGRGILADAISVKPISKRSRRIRRTDKHIQIADGLVGVENTAPGRF